MQYMGSMRDGEFIDKVYMLDDGRIRVVWHGDNYGIPRTVQELRRYATRVMSSKDKVAIKILKIYQAYAAQYMMV